MTELIDIAQQLLKVEKEFNEIKKKTFWKLYIRAIEEEEKKAINHCIKDKDDIRFFQGKMRMIEDIKTIPGNIVKQLRLKRGSEEISSR